MKTIPTALQAAYDAQVATLAHRWVITRRDGQVFRFTDHDRDLSIDGATWFSVAGFSASAVKTAGDLSADVLEVEAALDASGITAQSIEAGLWDFARVEFYRFDWANPSAGAEYLRRGEIGQIRVRDGQVVVELRGLAQALQTTVGRITAVPCDADLGDARCKVNLAALTVAGTVTGVTSRQQFTASALTQADGYFAYGKVTWLTGANAGASMEVRSSTNAGVIVLQLPLNAAIVAGDTFNITPGCDKTLATCRDKFSNVTNHRGFPHVSGNDKLIGG